MSYQDDPNINRPRDIRAENAGWSAGSIILGSLAALAVVFGIFYMMSGPSSTVATRTDRPAVTTNAPVTTPTTTPAQPRATTGAGPATSPAPSPSPNR